MAIFRPSAIVGAISGDAGGACFVNSRGSKVVRKKRRTSPNNDPSLIRSQALFANVARNWRILGDDVQAAWHTYALSIPGTSRLGVSRTLSGYQAFVQNTLFLSNFGAPVYGLPPVTADDPIITPLSFFSSEVTGLQMAVGVGPIAGDFTTVTTMCFLPPSTASI